MTATNLETYLGFQTRLMIVNISCRAYGCHTRKLHRVKSILVPIMASKIPIGSRVHSWIVYILPKSASHLNGRVTNDHLN